MIRARDLMSSEVVTVSPELTLREVVDLLATGHISGAPVVAGNRVLGVISASDVLAFEAVTPGVPTAGPPEEPEWELEIPEEWEEGSEAPAAFFTDMWVDAGADVSQRIQDLGAAEWDVLGEHTVSEAMTPSVCAVKPEAEVADVARYMLRRQIHRVLVMDDQKLVGIVAASDIVRAVAERRLE